MPPQAVVAADQVTVLPQVAVPLLVAEVERRWVDYHLSWMAWLRMGQ